MRIVQLTPGTGSFYCGSCLRDVALVEALQARGHDVLLAPLYLPFQLEEAHVETPVHLGGINVFLQHKLRWTRHMPRRVQDWLDTPGLLRWASRRSGMTRPAQLGELTLSMLSGEEGRQVHELEKLTIWLKGLAPPDVVLLSNAMLVGLARGLREALGVPILCTLQGEAPFLDGLPESHRQSCWDVLAERARDVDGFLAVSRYTRDLMVERLKLDPARVEIVPNGIDVAAARGPVSTEPRPPTLGYLARLCRDKGLPTLVDAFLELKRRPRMEGVRFEAVGVELAEDRPLVAALKERLASSGLGPQVAFHANVSRAEKLAFLGRIDVLSVPATYGESFGLYLLEAWANGVPVVQPRHGAFPELIQATGGGFLCDPDDPIALADRLEELFRDPERARALGAAGRAAVERDYTAERMARDVERVCAGALARRGAPAGSPR